ncbi:hypothetical protein GCM10020367_56660 [Streptomyces sannanensis]|uniref:DUF397 domain-containing protein n=1 Tax=Streptomyces sannanensis TaxID=285536 RepID=A0ABP6SJJ9_9ACTN
MTELAWQKSSYCGEGESCLHAAAAPDGTVELTESSDPARTVLTTTRATWASWLQALKAGDTSAAGIEVEAAPHDGIRIRSAETPSHVVTTTSKKWHAFVLGAQDGEFDHLAGT